ncbi:ATP-binding protein [Roseofilum sp. Belize Diploria]|uniref:ATP-binding protein n=1 Tax=Roseofilum sp. Belize Diploria TaxID=2821501 RepID=UPI000E9514A9|nr:ATP-binding protein [Roseofilum sp. Belize Diploria]MBP0008413.1 ATP-binding protein [Roseofilum sp. Belize Diploria]HBR00441.1 ATPase domain-containing protein [Cyanobacteria bacterium UBA11691]
MVVTEVLQFVDRLVFDETGKHLDDIQKAVVKGVWQGESYEEIAQECHRSESRVRDVGYKLWRILSERLEEDVNKSNFLATIERLHISSSQNICVVTHHNINFCSTHQSGSLQNPQNHPVDSDSKRASIDLELAPEITYFEGRSEELEKLSECIFNQPTRLMAVLGLSGIGKTTLVRRFIDLHLDSWEAVIWKSLKFPKSLSHLLHDILTTFKPETEKSLELDEQITQVFELLSTRRCLLIFDDVQNLFIPGQFAGQYQPEYTDYRTFFKMMAEVSHQSCLILISQEKSPEMISLDAELYPIQSLELGGFDAEGGEFVQYQGLSSEENLLDLSKLYQGNPFYLQSISSLIKEVFSGEVNEFMAEDSLIFTEEMKSVWNTLWMRLSQVEKDIILEMSRAKVPMYRDDLRNMLTLSSLEVVNSLQSLTRRYLLNSLQGDRHSFILNSIFQEYLKLFLMI